MTLNELIQWAKDNGVDFETHIAIGEKDDTALIADNISVAEPYFGNCENGGQELLDKLEEDLPQNEDGEESRVNFIILGTGY